MTREEKLKLHTHSGEIAKHGSSLILHIYQFYAKETVINPPDFAIDVLLSDVKEMGEDLASLTTFLVKLKEKNSD